MKIKGLIEITPEIRKEAFELLQACERLKRLIQEQYEDAHFGISAASNRLSPDDLTIFDRHEYSKDGEGNDLGFFVHKFYSDGKYWLDFIPEESKEAQAFREAINEAQEAEDGENG
jgi:hypothetical protein